MTAHPEPSAPFDDVQLVIRTFPKAQVWCRIHRSVHGALHFGMSAMNRFDAPAAEFGVLYAGRDAHCAFIETFGHATGTRSVSEGELAARELSFVCPRRNLRLVDVRGAGLARMGADASLTMGTDYALAQRWSLAIHGHRRKPDGIVYRARHDPSRSSVALFDRVATELDVKGTGTLMAASNRKLLADILDTYAFGLVP